MALVLAPLSVLASSTLVVLVEFVLPNLIKDGGWAHVEANVSTGEMIYALSVAPILENLILYAVVALSGKIFRGNLLIAGVAATLAAMVHVFASGHLAYVSVFPGFFIMSLLILHANRRSTGYWLSVLHHLAINSISVAGLLLVRQ